LHWTAGVHCFLACGVVVSERYRHLGLHQGLHFGAKEFADKARGSALEKGDQRPREVRGLGFSGLGIGAIMPTTNIGPSSDLELQKIADALARSRKVVVVTGAGISTNCGIPDFRSENGLYSLIQAQYDAATKSSTGSSAGDSGDEMMAATESPPIIEDSIEVCQPRRRVGRPPKEKRNLSNKRCCVNNSRVNDTNRVNKSTRRRPVNQPPTKEKPVIVPSLAKRVSDIKGKDLFDSMVWNSHLSTSIFLTFIASLRRQIRNDVKETTATHKFIRVLRDGGRLVRCYTQNIDGLEAREGLEMDLSRGQGSRSRFSAQILKEQRKPDSSIRGPSLDGGVEVVGLHGGLSHLRCGLCQKLCPWDGEISSETDDSNDPNDSSSPADSDESHAGDALIYPVTTKTSPRTERFVHPMASAAREAPPVLQPTLVANRRKLRNRSISLPPEVNLQMQIQEACVADEKSEQNAGEATESFESQSSQATMLDSPSSSQSPESSQATTMSFEDTLLSGSAPECKTCSAKNAKRERGGRRSLAIGRLRPDVVLYGEEHPSAHLIGPLLTHDISLSPDVLLILGTSLKVHGLKVMVKEFARAVHARRGKVVFVNNTKPSESIWGDVIDYWVEWDCDAWVEDLRRRRDDLWLHRSELDPRREAEARKARLDSKRSQSLLDDTTNGAYHGKHTNGLLKKGSGREKQSLLDKAQASDLNLGLSTSSSEAKATVKKRPSRPSATRDCTLNAAHIVSKIMNNLRSTAPHNDPSDIYHQPYRPLHQLSPNTMRLPQYTLPKPPNAQPRATGSVWPAPTPWPVSDHHKSRPSTREETPVLPTPPASDPSTAAEGDAEDMSPGTRRIKDLGSIQAILSSPLGKRTRSGSLRRR
jgi:NAD-dependent SIR2 family protein deacetylase